MPQRRERKRPNLRDVAKAANVSVATVSRVLNTPSVVQSDTRRRVEEKIASLGFVPSAAARAINSGRSKIVGALIPTLDNDIFALTIDAIENRLVDFGFSLVVATTGDDPTVEERKAKELLDIGVEGLFVTGITHSDTLHTLLERTRTPTVAISYYDPNYHLPTIGYDNRTAAKIACEHLLESGHRNIAIVHGPAGSNDRTRERIEGAASERADVLTQFFEAELSVSGGCAVVPQVLKSDPVPDAILCVSDVLAFGVLLELQRHDILVPKDISVIGLHDLPAAKQTYPRLSTVRLPAQEMGKKSAEALVEWIVEDKPPRPYCFATDLKVRGSTRRRV